MEKEQKQNKVIYNDGANEIIAKIIELELKIRRCQLPDEEYIFIGLYTILELVKSSNPKLEDLELLYTEIKNVIYANTLILSDFSITLGIEMGLNIINKSLEKGKIR